MKKYVSCEYVRDPPSRNNELFLYFGFGSIEPGLVFFFRRWSASRSCREIAAPVAALRCRHASPLGLLVGFRPTFFSWSRSPGPGEAPCDPLACCHAPSALGARLRNIIITPQYPVISRNTPQCSLFLRLFLTHTLGT